MEFDHALVKARLFRCFTGRTNATARRSARCYFGDEKVKDIFREVSAKYLVDSKGMVQLEESGNDTQAAVNTAVISNGNLGKTRWHSLN